MNKRKKISIGFVTSLAIIAPIALVSSCKDITAEANKDINYPNLNYKKSGINGFKNLSEKIKEDWDNKMGEKFIIKITNKSNKSKEFSILKKDGELKRDKKISEIKDFYEQ
ncbi:Vmc-like lipoprotein signal peptide domain-containing protein [Mycoplasma marinum]|uniref:Variable surface lipoprotein n=1 Tax=Mycoplasma marinum TaxID=1937190 RepID=A0A4R0XV83_9MOLU|nr:hypothetical protein [Mycoplasma marinum]TCG10821.1 hypothetical protein C4B24_03775 [Mycoplasma marinum]